MIKSKQLLAAVLFFAASLAGSRSQPATTSPVLISVQKIWNAGEHNAFTDLIRFNDQWLCTFRESEAHVGGNGKIRVLSSQAGDKWASIALLAETGVDLRDPKLSVTPDGQLMLTLGGSVYSGKTMKERQPRVAFSKDGREWTPPRRIMERGDWLWRVTWHKGTAYGISYVTPTEGESTNDWRVNFVTSGNGIDYRLVKTLVVPGRPNEATVRFLDGDECLVLVRREASDKSAWMGRSKPPFTDWRWQPAGLFIGGPNFVVLPKREMIAGGRQMNPKPDGPKMFVGRMDENAVTPQLTLPSGGDCSYPGMVWHDDTLWISYYSSHEGRSSIYLAKVKLALPAK